MISAIIIDDEQHCIDRLQHLVKGNCSELVKVLGCFKSIDDGSNGIKELDPQLVLLDVQLGNQTGFDLLRSLPEINFETIFITGYDQFAVQAFRFSAFDYLLKPVQTNELMQSIRKLHERFWRQQQSKKMETLFHNLEQINAQSKKIALPTSTGLLFVNVSDIIRCEAAINYTKIFLRDGKTITIAKTLKEYEQLLSPCNFFRVHNSHLINLSFIKEYQRGKGGTITLLDNTQVEVSTRRKEEFLKKMSAL